MIDIGALEAGIMRVACVAFEVNGQRLKRGWGGAAIAAARASVSAKSKFQKSILLSSWHFLCFIV